MKSGPEKRREAYDLVPKVAKAKAVRQVLSKSFGLGGVNAALVLSVA